MLSRATSAFAQLEAERTSLQAVQVLLFLLLALLVLLAAVWVGLLLARRVTRPIAALAASVRRVGAGDFDTRVEVEGADEIATLGRAFNAMTDELRESRGRLVSANAELQSAYATLDEDRLRIRTILAHLDVGVLAFGPLTGEGRGEARLEGMNDAALRMLRRAGAPPGTPMSVLLDEEWRAPLLEFLDRAFRGTGPREATLSLAAPGAREPLVVEAHATNVPGDAGEKTAWVVTLEDTTALVRAERAAAWEEAARRMAHEIKNPLTPVRLAAERIRRKARGSTGCDPALAKVVEEGADTIVQEVRTLAALVDAFHRFARLPETQLRRLRPRLVVGQVVKLYDGTKAGVRIAADVPEGLAAGEGRRAADQARRRQPRRQRRLGDPSRRGGAHPRLGGGGAGPRRRHRRRAGDPGRGAGPRLRADLLDEGRRLRPRALDHLPDRRRAPRAGRPGGEFASRMPLRPRMAGRVTPRPRRRP